jgi:plasmid maintenance system antidote protein VapI
MNMQIPVHLGTVPVLRERLPEGMRIEQAAKQIHISRTTLSKVLNAKSNLSTLMALRLAA